LNRKVGTEETDPAAKGRVIQRMILGKEKIDSTMQRRNDHEKDV
jgi:hypothetical protein